jgi:hypothetical protein
MAEPSPKMKRVKKRRVGDELPWRKVDVDVGALLLGSTEAGFMGLEEIPYQEYAPKLISLDSQQPEEEAEQEATLALAMPPKPPKKRAKKQKATVARTPIPSNRSAAPLGDSWKEFELDPRILQALSEEGFAEPTEIQKEVLRRALISGCDILAASETVRKPACEKVLMPNFQGSGKTLAFGLPVVNQLLAMDLTRAQGVAETEPAAAELSLGEEDAQENDGDNKEQDGNGALAEAAHRVDGAHSITMDNSLEALILVPTRELAMQVSDHLRAICKHTPLKVSGVASCLLMVCV